MRSASLLVNPGDQPVNHADAIGWDSPRSEADDIHIRMHLVSVGPFRSRFVPELMSAARCLEPGRSHHEL